MTSIDNQIPITNKLKINNNKLIKCIDINRKCTYIIIGNFDSSMSIFDINLNLFKTIEPFYPDVPVINDIKFSPDDKEILVCSS